MTAAASELMDPTPLLVHVGVVVFGLPRTPLDVPAVDIAALRGAASQALDRHGDIPVGG